MILTALYAAVIWNGLIALTIWGISLYGANLSKLRDQRAADGVNWSIEA